ncbi:MAG: hypothetical protein Q8P35_00040 [Candidatus Yanofskybacteria bacterium]|nr:hypothetical protein [Candidatus Yanofskybacteria bacterium]
MKTILILLIVALVALGVYFLMSKDLGITMAPAASITPILTTSSASPSGSAISASAKTYTSQNLGIRFQYAETQPNSTQKISVSETTDRVYVYPAGTQSTSGQYVRVFAKTASDTLVDSVKKQVLQNFPQCQVLPISSGSNLQAVQLLPPQGNASACPSAYANIDGLAYFAMDPSKPDKLIFFSIGQYAILAGSTVTWHSTLEIL